jgi:cephalosporin hydroxylase
MSQPLLRGDALKQAGRKLAADLQSKIDGVQQGVGTFSDHVLFSVLGRLERLDDGLPWEDSVSQLGATIDELRLAVQRLQLLLGRRGQGRFVEFHERAQAVTGGADRNCDLSDLDLMMSQGVFDCMHWRGMPLFKTVYDFSIYTMLLWALKPRTIIELGSGTGASAVWLADLTETFGIDGKVYSVDLKKPELQHDAVTFIQGDCLNIESVMAEDVLADADHPWLVIEDAHVNVYGVLRHFHPYVRQGDYVVIEDSASKKDDITRFLLGTPGCYAVDTYFTDFFGRNVTCAQDSIFVRT